MSRLNELKQRVDEYRIAEMTAATLEEISVLRMQAIRTLFEQNRSFYEGIRDLYGAVQAAATTDAATDTPKESRNLYVAITSNKRFFGSLMRDIIVDLARSLEASPKADGLVVGSIGMQYAKENGLGRRVRETLFEADVPTAAEFENLFASFARYDRVFVLYPKFINAFRQEVGIEDITESPYTAIVRLAGALEPHTSAPVNLKEGYIFEPDVSEILAFFNTQVQRAVLSYVLLEAELARTATRLLRMDEAQDRAHQLVQGGQRRVSREMSALSNTALLETFAGFTQWNHL